MADNEEESKGEEDVEEGDEPEDAVYEPEGRRGACSAAYNGKVYISQGYKGGLVSAHLVEKVVQVFDPHLGVWSTEETKPANDSASEAQRTEAEEPVVNDMPLSISGACCAVINDCLYVFGGWVSGCRTAGIHELSFRTLTWRAIECTNPKDGPFLKDKAGMVAYGQEMLCVFGGYGYPGRDHIEDSIYRGQKGARYDWDTTSFYDICWTNELHLFHLGKCMWLSPETTGPRPPPCAAFTFTKVDCHRVVLFAGRQQRERVNDIHILNMERWEWSGAILPVSPEEPWPQKRSFHSACALVNPACICPREDKDSSTSSLPPWHPNFSGPNLDWLPCPPPLLSPPEWAETECCHLNPRLFVLWGMDNYSDPIHDAWVFHINSLTWKQVTLPPSVSEGRIWHTAAAIHPTPGEAKVVAFGGCAENLFQRYETHIPSKAGTTVISFGVAALFELCLEVVAEHHSYFSPLIPNLPGSIQSKVEDCCHRQENLSHFTAIKM